MKKIPTFSYLKYLLSFDYTDRILSVGVVMTENYVTGIDEDF